MSEYDELNKSLLEHAQSEKIANQIISKYHSNKPSTKISIGGAYMPYEDEEKENKITENNYVQWSSSDGKVFLPAAKTTNKLTPGVYEININPNIGLYFEKIPVRTEGLLKFPDTSSDKVVSEIQKFWEREQLFVDYKLIYKRGILLYGPPGSGKSCTIQLIMEDVVSRGGLVIKFTDPSLFISGMRALRQIQSDTPVVVTLEDVDSIIEDYSESEILNILDGINEVKKVVFLATTNYPGKLGARVVNRPSRFDKRFRIGYPSAEARKMYFEFLIRNGSSTGLKPKTKNLKIDIDKWVKDTDEMSIAHLKELFVAVIILDDPYEEAIKTLKSMTEVLEDKDYDNEIGFHVQKSSNYYN